MKKVQQSMFPEATLPLCHAKITPQGFCLSEFRVQQALPWRFLLFIYHISILDAPSLLIKAIKRL